VIWNMTGMSASALCAVRHEIRGTTGNTTAKNAPIAGKQEKMHMSGEIAKNALIVAKRELMHIIGKGANARYAIRPVTNNITGMVVFAQSAR
jgi:hypothetical protein